MNRRVIFVTTAMTPFQNHFTKAHLFVFLGIWLGFTALTYWIAEHGIEQDSHRRLVILTTLGTILGPMTGAISRNCQSCCVAFSLSLLPYCGAFLAVGTLPLSGVRQHCGWCCG